VSSLLFGLIAVVTIDFWRHLLGRHDSFIMSCCRKLVGNSRRTPDEADDAAVDLYNRVTEHLSANDYEKLRTYRNDAKIESFLSVCISRTHIDHIIHREGKDARRSRAEELYGDLGVKVFKLAIQEGRPVEEVHQILRFRGWPDLTFAEVAATVEVVSALSRSVRIDPDVEIYREFDEDCGDDPVPVPGAGRSAEPEHQLGEAEMLSLRSRLLDELVASMSGEEQMIVLMRHPLDEELTPLTFKEIGERLKTTHKKVEHVYYGALKQLKTLILARGVAMDDLFSR
jgi:RNA polymerase sigma factor (sigma-70 family)